MARPRKNEEVTTPWVVRDVPAHIRRKVRVYAAEHDMTMAQAIEAMVESRYGSEEDRILLQALIKVYGRLIADDIPGAYQASVPVTAMLEQWELEGRNKSLLELAAPKQPSRTKPPGWRPEDVLKSLDLTALDPMQVVEAYTYALYEVADYNVAAQLLSETHPLREGRTVEETAQILKAQQTKYPRSNKEVELMPPFIESDVRCYIETKYLQVRWEDTPKQQGVVVHEKFTLAKEGGRWLIIATRKPDAVLLS
jgi:hypothetical protein